MGNGVEINKADLAWTFLVGGVIAYDVLGEQTMSERFDEYLEHPIGKYVAIGATALIGAHLLNIFDHFDTPDPITLAGDVVSKIRRSDGTTE